ncbi:hypothetical protein [Sutcliffiella horikoshii]|uniref:Uncharacterized protein n=1 Tax=Sutcliffiella horikoshii TaxID=79883 RepID=A0A5D4TA36_9BACI|nr:hypothetical protein [Sutcliffiella horikoshii]TYS71761.1 hypothetical protein FZC75_11400 [Sutcliffiella horikoshii]
MKTQDEVIIKAFKALGGVRSIQEIEKWVVQQYGEKWKDFGTSMADMVPTDKGGTNSSLTPLEYRVLERVGRGRYKLL